MSDSVGKVSLDIELEGGDLDKQVKSMSGKVGGGFTSAIRSSLTGVLKGLKNMRAPIIPAPKIEEVKAAGPQVDTEAVKAQIGDLSSVLDNVNAKIEIQQRKLAELNDSYENAFSDKRKNKLQEKIANTEGALLRLTQSSDKTARKIWELEDSLERAGEAAQQADKPVKKLGTDLKQTNRTIDSSKQKLTETEQATKTSGAAFLAAGNKAGKMGNQFTAAFSRILKQVFVFTVLYKAIRGFNEYLGASLKTNAQFAASLNAIKTNLAVAFQPIYDAILPAINALMSAVAKITAYIAAFISALFGKTYKQSYDAAKGIETAKKNLEGYGKAAKKAGKDAKGALASFDELNTLDMSKADAGADAGAGGFEMAMPDMDIGGIQAQMDSLVAGIKSSFDSTWQAIRSGWDWTVKTFGPSFATAWSTISPVLGQWKESFRVMFADIMTLGRPLANWVLTGLVPLWQRGIVVAGNVVAGLLDSLLNVFNSIRTAVFPILEWFVTIGLPIITEFVSGALDIFWSLFSGVKQIFDDLWSGVVDPVMKLISKIILDTLNIIKGFWDDWGKRIVEGIKVALDGIKKLWTSLWESFLKPFVINMLNMLTQLWDKHLKGLVKEITTFVGKLAIAALDIFNKFIMPIVNWLVQKLGPVFAEIFDGILKVIGSALGGIIDAAKGIIKALGGVVDFIAGVFTLDWKRAWNGIKDFTGGIFDAIVGIFKGAINIIIDAFNWMLRQINKVSFDVPDWVPGIGGETVGFKIPEIPRLAKGGLAYGPTLAMVGDNRGASVDPEVVSPLSKLQDMLGANNQPIVEVLLLILDALKSGDKETVLKIGETEFGRLAIKSINNAQRQAGRTLLNV